jgi:hypothetical protein
MSHREYHTKTNVKTINTVQENAFHLTNYQRFLIQKSDLLTKVNRVSIRYTLSLTNDTANATTRLVGTPFWFDNITISTDNTEMNVITPYSKMAWMASKLNGYELRYKAKQYNMCTTDDGFLGDTTKGWLPGPVPPFYFDLDETALNKHFRLWLEGMESTIEFKTFPMNTIISSVTVPPPVGQVLAVAAPTPTKITITDISFVFDTVQMIARDIDYEREESKCRRHFRYTRNDDTESTVTYTPGDTIKIPLTGIEGLFSKLDVFICQANATNADNGFLTGLNTIGHGTLDLTDTDGTSFICVGGYSGHYLQTKFQAENCDDDIMDKFPSWYSIPLGSQPQKSYD